MLFYKIKFSYLLPAFTLTIKPPVLFVRSLHEVYWRRIRTVTRCPSHLQQRLYVPQLYSAVTWRRWQPTLKSPALARTGLTCCQLKKTCTRSHQFTPGSDQPKITAHQNSSHQQCRTPGKSLAHLCNKLQQCFEIFHHLLYPKFRVLPRIFLFRN